MRAMILTAVTCLISATAFAPPAEPLITSAPSGQYSIVQNLNSDANINGYDENNVLRFRDKSKRDVILKPPSAFDTWGPHRHSGVVNLVYAADYFISPDEQWIIRDQKVGSGCSVLILYRVEPNGRVQRFVLNRLAFDCIGRAPDHYGHMWVQFVSWDIPSGVVHLAISAGQGMRWSTTKQQGILDPNAYPEVDGRPITYDLKKHRMKAD